MHEPLSRNPVELPHSKSAPGPLLVTVRVGRLPHTKVSLLARWHLLSLDAPTVAALWTWFLARCAGITLPRTSPLAMFVAVWMIYAADRLLDARALESPNPQSTTLDLEERHRFHHLHRNRFLAVLALAAITLVWLLPRMSPRALLLYTLLATLLGTWLLIIHARSHQSRSNHRLPKELAVGIFFSAAVFIPTVARAPGLQRQLLPCALLFAAVCTLNCLFVYAWEHPHPAPSERDAHHQARRQAHWTTLWAVQHLPQIALFIAAVSLGIMLLAPPVRLPATACAISALLLLLLHVRRHHTSAIHLRAAADAVLLTPALLLPLLAR